VLLIFLTRSNDGPSLELLLAIEEALQDCVDPAAIVHPHRPIENYWMIEVTGDRLDVLATAVFPVLRNNSVAGQDLT